MKRDAEFILIEMVVMIAGGPGVMILYTFILVSIFILIKKYVIIFKFILIYHQTWSHWQLYPFKGFLFSGI